MHSMSPKTNAKTAICFLAQTISLRKAEIASGREPLQVPSTLLRNLARLRSGQSRRHGADPDEGDEQSRRLTGATDDTDDAADVASLLDQPLAVEVLQLCACVSSLEIDGKDDRVPRAYDFRVFPNVRKLHLSRCLVRSITGVESVAALSVRITPCDRFLESFITLRNLETDHVSMSARTLTWLCYSLRRLTIWIDGAIDDAFVPHFLVATGQLRRFDRSASDLRHWDALTWVTFSRHADASNHSDKAPERFLRFDPSLQYLQNLQRVELCRLQIKSFEGLEALRLCLQLRSVNLSHNLLQVFDSSALPPTVSELLLHDNQLSSDSMSRFASMAALTAVDLSNNDIVEWAPVRQLPESLKVIALKGNPVCEVSGVLFRDDDEYCTFVRSILLRQCKDLTIVDNLQVKPKHLKSDADSRMKNITSSMGALRGVSVRTPDPSQNKKGLRPKTASSEKPPDRPALKSALKPAPKSRGRRKVRTVSDSAELQLPDDNEDEIIAAHIRSGRAEDVLRLQSRYPHSYIEHLPMATPAQQLSLYPRNVMESDSAVNSAAEVDSSRPPPAAKKAVVELRREPASLDQLPVLLERFLKSLLDVEWQAQGKERKPFSSGLIFDHSKICAENASIWEVATADDPAARLYKCNLHETAREVLLRDARMEPQLQDHARFKGKMLVRVIETQSGQSRYVKMECKTVDKSFAGQRAQLIVALGATCETATRDVQVTAAFNVEDDGTEDASVRPRGSIITRTPPSAPTSHVLASDTVGQEVGHVLYEVGTTQLLAGFVVPMAAAQTFCAALREQCVSCLGTLVTNGIVRQWPKHFDGSRHRSSEDLSHAIPVKDGKQLFLDQLKVQEEADPARQRHGCECIFTRNDELRVHLQCRVFNEPLDALCVLYGQVWEGKRLEDGADVLARPGVESVLCISSTHIHIAEDRNYREAHQSKYVSETETFVKAKRFRMSELEKMIVSYDGQQFAFFFGPNVLYCRPLDRAATLSAAGALAQAGKVSLSDTGVKGAAPPFLEVRSCPYPFLTSAPLIFGVNAYVLPHGTPLMRGPTGGVARPFPLRHLEEALASRMMLVSFVITATDVCLVQVANPFETGDRTEKSCRLLHKTALANLTAIDVVSGAKLFPLIFSAVFRTPEGREGAWLFCAPHPATISLIVKQLRTGATIRTRELSVAKYRSIVDSSISVANAAEEL